MNRKDFFKKGAMGLGTIVALPSVITSCTKDDEVTSSDDDSGACTLSPAETEGPYPIKTPAQLVRENIISDRTGIALLINITVQNLNANCEPLSGVLVDIWHCDSDGNYSEYGNFTSAHFLRGRQTTNEEGKVSFISIYPGWYPGRAPHIHVEVLSSSGSSLLVTQIAFPEDVSEMVYATSGYNGSADTSNTRDGIFSDSLDGNMGTITGNTTDGYTLSHTITVRA